MALSQTFVSVNRILFWDVTKTVCHVACSTFLGTSHRNPWRSLKEIAGWVSHLASVCRSKRSALKTYLCLPPGRWSTISLWSWRPSSHQGYQSCDTNYITENWQNKIRRTSFEENDIYNTAISTYSNFLIRLRYKLSETWNQAEKSSEDAWEAGRGEEDESKNLITKNPTWGFLLL